MKIDIITIFPQMFESTLKEGVIKIALEKKLVDVKLHNLRDYVHNKHSQIDDAPYGGGFGMVMKPGPFFEAVESISKNSISGKPRVILLTPQGRPFNQRLAEELSREKYLIVLCGRYEGIDERVHEDLATDEISIGDYILSGGEYAAMALVDSVIRLIPGVLGKHESLAEETFTRGLLEYPQYTRPREWQGWAVPEILISGHHEAIRKWRIRKSLEKTLARRPDLIHEDSLTEEEKEILKEIKGLTSK